MRESQKESETTRDLSKNRQRHNGSALTDPL